MNFIFNGRSSKEFGIITTKVSAPNFGMTRDPIRGEMTKYRTRTNMFGTKYSNNLSFTITVMKDVCTSKQNELHFTSKEIRKITSWLTSPQFPKSFKFDGNDYFTGDDVEYFVVITNIANVEEMGRIYQLEIEIMCNSPFAWSPEHSISALSEGSTVMIVENNSDELEDYTYPCIEITPSTTGEISIVNGAEPDRILTIQGLRDVQMIIDCEKRKFTDELGNLLSFSDMGIEDVDKIYFPRLIHGQNSITITGPANVTIKHREARKVGAF